MNRVLIILAVTFGFHSTTLAGAFGIGAFENDDAFELLMLLEEETSTDFLARIFEAIERSSTYIQAPDCSIAIAGAEVIAFSLNRRVGNAPSEVEGWVKKYSIKANSELSKAARKAIRKCQEYEGSELRQLWSDSEYMKEWSVLMDDLNERLK